MEARWIGEAGGRALEQPVDALDHGLRAVAPDGTHLCVGDGQRRRRSVEIASSPPGRSARRDAEIVEVRHDPLQGPLCELRRNDSACARRVPGLSPRPTSPRRAAHVRPAPVCCHPARACVPVVYELYRLSADSPPSGPAPSLRRRAARVRRPQLPLLLAEAVLLGHDKGFRSVALFALTGASTRRPLHLSRSSPPSSTSCV